MHAFFSWTYVIGCSLCLEGKIDHRWGSWCIPCLLRLNVIWSVLWFSKMLIWLKVLFQLENIILSINCQWGETPAMLWIVGKLCSPWRLAPVIHIVLELSFHVDFLFKWVLRSTKRLVVSAKRWKGSQKLCWCCWFMELRLCFGWCFTDLTVLHLVQISLLHLFSFIQYWYHYSLKENITIYVHIDDDLSIFSIGCWGQC